MMTIFECMDNFENSNIFLKDSSEVQEIEEKTDMEFEVRYNVSETESGAKPALCYSMLRKGFLKIKCCC